VQVEFDGKNQSNKQTTKSTRETFQRPGGTGGQLLWITFLTQTERQKKSCDAQRQGKYKRMHE